ncbi:ROK family protein [Leptothermofonsia sichuanensis E412]|uniref:ROK family protein n=1 Tax=Leptothermofonsia sichuanensis TaxID=2917832 RepID=UPI001CA61823|nr:ROK family protein [Leptothermofonsia sichuanensis]QZZ18687.1 ROK family protein [Leptothermofonsia sichuanensis E412]
MHLQTLTVDIGGSGIKVMVLDAAGNPVVDRDRRETPQPAKPEAVIDVVLQLAADKTFDRVSVGFPGVIKQGVTMTAANLDLDWIGFDLADTLSHRLGKPVRVINDADMQGLGAVSGQGVELVITLGTGLGSALFLNGVLIPNLELGHHEFRKGQTYEEQLGRAALDRDGKKKWNDRLLKAIASLQNLFNYDTLYIGGGNTKHIMVELPANVRVVPNVSGLLGGIALWRD